MEKDISNPAVTNECNLMLSFDCLDNMFHSIDDQSSEESSDKSEESESSDSDEDKEYEVESVLDFQPSVEGTKYKIKWRGYSESESTWETKENMMNSTELIEIIKKQMD